LFIEQLSNYSIILECNNGTQVVSNRQDGSRFWPV
jgi:hypothetical protein